MMLTIFAIPAWLCYVILYPISRIATLLSKGILRIFGVKMNKNIGDKEFTKVDLDYLVQSSIDNAKDDEEIGEEVRIFQNALDFSETRVRDCMVPRTEIDSVEDTDTISDLKQVFTESGHSKIVVYHEDIDHVIGYIHSSDMFRLTASDNVRITELKTQIIREISFVPETMFASKLMKSLMQQVAEGEYVLSARLEIEKVNEMFALELPESDEYMTIGGLILHEYQSFPKLNEVIRIKSYEFKILKNTATKIELVRLKVME